MTQTRHYRYSACGHVADPALKDFANSKLSHVRFCDAYSGQETFEREADFEAVDVAPDQLRGLCPKCLRLTVCTTNRESTLPAQMFRSSTVPHQHQCQDGACRMQFVIRKGLSGTSPHEAARGEKSRVGATQFTSKKSTWSALFNKSGDSTLNSLRRNGIIILRGHQEDDDDEASHDFVRTLLSERLRRKAYTPGQLPIAAYHDHDTVDDGEETR